LIFDVVAEFIENITFPPTALATATDKFAVADEE
jgi:hypothetical protein